MPDPASRETELSEQLARSAAQLVELQCENKLLREKIDALIKRLYGAQSEKIDPGQLLLMLQGLDAPGKAPEPVEAEAPRRSTDPSSPPHGRGPRVPEHLPVVEEVIDPEPVKACPEAWRCIGEEVTEQLDYEPARFFKRRIVRRKYARRDHPFAAPILAPLCTLQDRCLAAPGLMAAVIHAALLRIRPRHLPQSATGRAITSILDQWPALERFVADGRIEIDNNRVETAIRPTALGKKNWLFVGAAQAGQRGAILYTIVESCRRRGIDPLAYLRDVLTRLPKMTTSQIPEVTPEAWGQAKRQPPEFKAAS